MEPTFRGAHTPSLYIQSKGEDISTKAALSLTKARDRVVVRITGGCGYMAPEDAGGLYDLFQDAFVGFGGSVLFGGVVLFGGTRMRGRKEPHDIVHGITEVGPLIGSHCKDAVVLGIVPKTGDIKLTELGVVVEDSYDKDFVTVIHPDQDVCLMVQQSVDQGVPWDTEYLVCMQIIEQLVTYVDWKPLLISYNGGSITEKEILAWSKRSWPVLLIKGSGRITERYAGDKEFLAQHPSVHVTEKNSAAMREKLIQLGALPSGQPQLRLVQNKRS